MERSVTRKDGLYTDWVRIAMLLLRMCNNLNPLLPSLPPQKGQVVESWNKGAFGYEFLLKE